MRCAVGAIGGATSALIANQIAGFVTNGQGNPSPEQLATITALTMLSGGGVAALFGKDPLAAAAAAQNETLNNTCAGNHLCGKAVDQPLQEAGPSGGGQIRFGSAAGAEGQVAAGVSNSQKAGETSNSVKSGVPGGDFTPNPNIVAPYSRPSGAGPTAEQKAAVQGKPCVDCGVITSNQVADHKDPLVVQYYRDGAVNVPAQRSTDAVQPHCPTYSASQGGQLGAFGKAMRKFFGFE